MPSIAYVRQRSNMTLDESNEHGKAKVWLVERLRCKSRCMGHEEDDRCRQLDLNLGSRLATMKRGGW